MKKVRTHFLVSTLAVTAIFALTTPASAQEVLGPADAGRVQERIAPLQSPQKQVAPTATPSVTKTRAPSGAEKTKFKLKSVSVEGMSAYNQTAIASLYKDKIGTTVSLADVYDLADKLTAKYRNEGYILTQVVVPPQTIDNGEIRLRVVEGFVDNVRIQGDTRQNVEYLNGYAKRIKAAKPLNAKALERYLLLINDLPGVTARAVLSPSQSTPGASDVTLIVEQKPVDLFFQADNRGSRFLGALQMNAGMRLNNTFGLYEGLNFQFFTAPDRSHSESRELDYGALTWSQPLGHEGTLLNLTGSVTSTHPGFTLEPFQTKGLAHSLNAQLSHPFIRTRSQNLSGRVKFDFLNTRRNDNLANFAEDRLRVARVGGTYQFTDGLLGINTVDGELSHGFGIFNASDKGDAGLTRARGEPNFFKGALTASRVQRITGIFEGFFGASAQKSAHTLLASEEFGVGGVNFGSAYDNSEITGEDGIAGRLELRANNAFSTPADFTQVYGFYDIGKVWDEDNAVAKERRRSLASAGAGARVTWNENFSGNVEIAVPLTRSVNTQGDNDPRYFGSVSARF